MTGKEPQVNQQTATEIIEPELESASDASDSEVDERDGKADPAAGKGRSLRLSISVRSIVLAGLIAVMVAGLGVLSWLYIGAERTLDEQVRQSQDTARAEKVALEYAANAAAMNFEDLSGWKVKLVAGTSPELKDKLSKAADEMEQVLVPLQWNSTATPLAAKVRSVSNGVYVVDSFVSVLTKTAQGPDPLQSTATYSVTVDSTKDWQITDVGGIGSAMEGR